MGKGGERMSATTFGGKIKLEGEREYRQAISQINSDLKVFSSEIGKLTAEFGKNDTSTKGLTERNKVLTEQIEKQKEKIATLKGAVEDSAEQYGEHDKKTNNWKTTLNKAEAELTKMEKELDSNNQQLDENGENLDDGSKSLDEFSKSEDESGQKALKFGDLVKANLVSEAIISGLKKLGEGITKVKEYLTDSVTAAASYGDNILTLSIQTGVFTQALQEYSAVVEIVDVSVDTMTGSMAKNIKSMTSAASGTGTAAEAYKKLGVSVTDSSGNLKDGEEVYWQVIDALGKISNETERDSIAMQILGKSAQDLNPLIAQGSAGIAELTSKSYEMGAVLSGETLNSLGSLDDSMQIWKSTAASTANLLGAVLAPSITEIITGANGMAGAFNGIIAEVLNGGSIDAAVQKFANMAVDMAQSLLQAVPKLLEAGKSLISALLQGLTAALPYILEAAGKIIPEIITGITSVLPQLTNAAITIIMALSTALINSLPQIIEAGIQVIMTLVSGISQSLPVLIPAIVSAVILIAQSLVDNIDLIIQAGIDLFMGLVQAIPQIIAVLVPKIPEIVNSIVNALVNNIPLLLDGAITLFMAIVAAIPEIIVILVQNVPQIVTAIINGLSRLPELIGGILGTVLSKFTEWGGNSINTGREKMTEFLNRVIDIIKNLPSRIWEWLNSTINKITEFFRNAVEAAKTKSKEFLDSVINTLKNLPQNVWNAIINAVSQVANWGTQMVNKGREAASNLFSAVVNEIKEIPSQVFSIGSNIVQGIWNGISNSIGWIRDKVAGFAKSILDGMKAALGIHSPSKVFEDEVGKNLALGVGEGFSDEMKLIQKEMREAIPTDFETDIKANINTIKTPLASYQDKANASGFNIYIENFVNNRSQDVQAFAQELEFYSRRNSVVAG